MIHHRSRAKEEASFATTSVNGQQCSVGIAVSLMMLDLLLSSWREVEKSRQLWDLPPLLWEKKGEGGTECGRARKLQKARKKIFLLLVLLSSPWTVTSHRALVAPFRWLCHLTHAVSGENVP